MKVQFLLQLKSDKIYYQAKSQVRQNLPPTKSSPFQSGQITKQSIPNPNSTHSKRPNPKIPKPSNHKPKTLTQFTYKNQKNIFPVQNQ